MISRTSYAIGNAERLAARGRSFVRNVLKGSKVITKGEQDEFLTFLRDIRGDWRVPRSIRDDLNRSIWDEFKTKRQFAVLASTQDLADRCRRLRLAA